MKVKRYVVIKPELAKAIFKELGDVEGLQRFVALTKLEQIIAETIGLRGLKEE